MANTQFPDATYRFDPYKNFKFIVSWGGKPVAGVSKVGGLTRSTQVVSHREGGDSSLMRAVPGQTDYGPITLERGVTHDPEFQTWANKVWNSDNAVGSEVSLQKFRKDITITLFNEAGQPVVAYNVLRCWVSEYTAVADLDSSGNAVLIQSLTLQHEGWQRDPGVAEPAEPDDGGTGGQ
jgi:phage tail-like protein